MEKENNWIILKTIDENNLEVNKSVGIDRSSL